jgi:hypothetical protein
MTYAPKEFFWIEDTRHRFESYSYFQDKPEKMLEWLTKWMEPSTQSSIDNFCP